MASYSEVKAGLDEIATIIRDQKAVMADLAKLTTEFQALKALADQAGIAP